MDRLTTLVLLRWRLELRAVLGARERLAGLLLALPVSLLFSLAGAFVAFWGARWLAGARPELALPLASAAATAVGLFWALSPLMAGVGFVEVHDLSRLTHFPVPARVLVAASLLANLLQPLVLAELPIVLALSLALAGGWLRLPLTLFGVLVSFATVLAGAQLVGLALHGLSRNRRLWDALLFVGLGFGFVVSLLPFLLLAGGGRLVGTLVRLLARGDLFALSPFGFGLRAAVHGGRGDLGPFALNALAGLVSLAALLALSAALIRRIYTGELALAPARSRAAGPARMPLPGRLGALVEKDLRLAWREPALKAVMLFGLVSPLLFLYFIAQFSRGASPASVLLLATFVGLGSFGTNAFGLERRGLALLLSFPIERWKVLVAKNALGLIFRLPGLLTLVMAGVVMAPPAYLPAALTIALATLAIAAGFDNLMSIWFPVPVPAPGRNPYGASSGGRGLGAALLSMLMLSLALLCSAPLAFLAWVPLLLDAPWLWLVTLPLALLGAAGVYALLVDGAAGQLERREPELLARVLGEE